RKNVVSAWLPNSRWNSDGPARTQEQSRRTANLSAHRKPVAAAGRVCAQRDLVPERRAAPFRRTATRHPAHLRAGVERAAARAGIARAGDAARTEHLAAVGRIRAYTARPRAAAGDPGAGQRGPKVGRGMGSGCVETQVTQASPRAAPGATGRITRPRPSPR